MSAALVFAAIVLVASSGVPGLFFDRSSERGERIAVRSMALGALLGVAGSSIALARREPSVISLPWHVPGGRLSLEVDAIAAMFLLQTFVIALLGSIYGLEYWAQARQQQNGRKLRLFYGLITAGIALLVAAKNTILFLLGWELMALSAFLLITTEDEKPLVRDAGVVYIMITHVGTLCLFAFFALLHATSGSFDFSLPRDVTPRVGTALFVLALVGFGLKAGLMPAHIWLPGAHSNAPSHVSALMSGVLIKTGIYGLVRFLSFVPDPPVWWGVLLFALGAVSGVLGVAFAIAQHDLKRLLAYHSIENIGIIVMGLGLAVLGRALARPELVVLGLAAALLHVWNHGLFKALLFLSAGAVLHATGTREMDRLGGLSKRMPRTSAYFMIGAVAICGLPPLNGFVSEYLLYVGLFRAAVLDTPTAWLVGALGGPVLALIGALAAACFVKAFGAVFLGEPRTADAREARESGRRMLGPMAALAIACSIIGLAPLVVVPVLERAVSVWAPEAAEAAPLGAIAPLGWISIAGVVLVGLILVLAAALPALTRRGGSDSAVTWDCGYVAPGASMQYTSSSFAQMLVGFFAWALRPHAEVPRVRGPLPDPQRFHSDVPDVVLDRLLRPAVGAVGRVFGWFRWAQQGSLHVYLLYILGALVVGFMWWR